MADKYAVIWTTVSGAPQKLANMVLTPHELRISKTEEAIDLKLPGISRLHDLAGLTTMSYERSAWSALPPQLEALLPPQNRKNPQRIILSRLLAGKIDVRGMKPLEKEWEMLLFAGRGGIGHLDIFKSDSDARAHYDKDVSAVFSATNSSEIWAAFKHITSLALNEEALDEMIEQIGVTPGVSGFNPKILMNIILDDKLDWQGESSRGAGTPAIIKIDTYQYPGILQLESLCYEIHRQAELSVPRTWLKKTKTKDGALDVLAIERFDRKRNTNPNAASNATLGASLPLESVFSILRTGSPQTFFENTDGSMELVSKAVEMTTKSQTFKEQFYSRFVLSFLTGNGDLHSENWAICGNANGEFYLSPVYDPAPMRAYRAMGGNHDLLSALSFDGIGGLNEAPYALTGDTPPDLGARLLNFASNIGLSKRRASSITARLLDVTASYADQAIALLNDLPADSKRPMSPDIDGLNQTLRQTRTAIGLIKGT